MRRRLVRARAAVLGLVATVASITWSGASERPRAVLELFTSQGCSSCPTADALLAQLAREPGLLALTLAVDYWDYLGWKDTLASHANTDRQRAYAEARGDRKVYTPQMVVNGTAHAVGSDRAAIERAILATRPGERTLVLDVRLEVSGNAVRIGIPPGDAPGGGGDILLVWLDSVVPVKIKRGENSGRLLAYHNVVRRFLTVGQWTGEAVALTVPEVSLTNGQRLAVLVQARAGDHPGAILGAALSEETFSSLADGRSR